MKNSPFCYAKWICPQEFAQEKPLPLYHKQQEKQKTETPAALQNQHYNLTRCFFWNGEGNVICRITGDDYYKLYINGQFVCQGPAQGYPWHYYFNQADVTPYLVKGENRVRVHLYYNGVVNRAYASGDRRVGLCAEFLQGETCLSATDEQWQYARIRSYAEAPTVGYGTLFAERLDARVGEDKPAPCAVITPDYVLAKKAVPTVTVYPQSPVLQEKLPNKGIFYDFGQLLTGTLRFTARGKAGSCVRVLMGEETENTPERVRWQMRCSCVCEDIYTLQEGENHFEQFDYRAFRYVAIIPVGDVTVTKTDALVRHWAFDDDYCRLETEDAVLREVWRICKNGVKYGCQEVYVDCPTREKGQYSGDLVITSASQYVLTGDVGLFRKALEDLAQSARICKGLMAVVPGGYMQEVADYSLQFPILALRYYDYTGDKALLKRCFALSEEMLTHFAAFARKDGLLERVTDKWNLVDWPDNLRDNYDFPLTDPIGEGCHNVINALYVGAVMGTEQMAKILNEKPQYRCAPLIDAFQKEFYDEEQKRYTDCKATKHTALHSNIFPAYFGFCPEEAKESIGNLLCEKGLCCGVYMAYFLLKALCRMERYGDAYALIVNQSEHSWYNMVREGATTCFEAWGKEQKWNTSLCHPWASGPISVLAEDILPHMPEKGRLIYKAK